MICRQFAQSFAFSVVALAAANLAAQAPAESPPAEPETTVSGVARLRVPTGGITALKTVETLPVRALPVAAGEPVRKGAVLVDLDLAKLQRELDETSRELRLLQDEARRRVSGRESRSASEELDLVMRQADAQRDLVTIQTGLSTALPRAPEDGYVVRFFYAVGSEAKRRKPILEFVAAGKTTLATRFAGGGRSSAAGRARDAGDGGDDRLGARTIRRGAFAPQSRAASPPPTAAWCSTLRPLELPFLALDRPTTVTLTLER